MSNYRTVYTDESNNRRVLTSVINDNTTVTSSLEKFIIDTLDSTVTRLAAWGVDVSYFWKQDMVQRFAPSINNPEQVISDHPSDADCERRVFAHSLSVEYANDRFRFNMIVRHFINGQHDTETYDDGFVSTIVDNSVLVDDGQGGQIGEYDYFLGLINSGVPLTTIQNQRIPTMDENNFFDSIYG